MGTVPFFPVMRTQVANGISRRRPGPPLVRIRRPARRFDADAFCHTRWPNFKGSFWATSGFPVESRRAGFLPGRELRSGQTVEWSGGKTALTLEGEDAAVLEIVAGSVKGKDWATSAASYLAILRRPTYRCPRYQSTSTRHVGAEVRFVATAPFIAGTVSGSRKPN